MDDQLLFVIQVQECACMNLNLDFRIFKTKTLQQKRTFTPCDPETLG